MRKTDLPLIKLFASLLKPKHLETLLLPPQENMVSLNKLSTAGDKNIKVYLPPKLNDLKLLKLKMLASKKLLAEKELEIQTLTELIKKNF